MLIKKIENILLYMLLVLIVAVFFVKKQTYEFRKDIIDIDTKIELLVQNGYIMDVELAYLTSPERLSNIFSKISEKVKNSPINITQVKEMKNIIPYYFAKNKLIDENNSIALHYEKNSGNNNKNEW